MFAGSTDAKAILLCASVDFFSTFFLRVSNQRVLSFNSGYSLSREIFKTLEWGTDKTDRSPCGHLLSVLSALRVGILKSSPVSPETRVQVYLLCRTPSGLILFDPQPTELFEHF